jgi:hypothetical protein
MDGTLGYVIVVGAGVVLAVIAQWAARRRR